jgi:hypothetical protein
MQPIFHNVKSYHQLPNEESLRRRQKLEGTVFILYQVDHFPLRSDASSLSEPFTIFALVLELTRESNRVSRRGTQSWRALLP